LESAAASIREFQPSVFPGLLQTPAYARAVHEGALPRLSQAIIEERIEVRRTRQQLLDREDGPRLAAVVDEAVLHRVVGGPLVMSAQLQRLITACERPTVTVQVLPFSIGAHPAVASTFILLEFPPPLAGEVYVEGLFGQIYLERQQDVQRYTDVFERLTAMSVSPDASVEMMKKMILSYGKE
jgi:hypothetical protein